MTIKADQYDAFKACFEAEVKARISETQRIPSIQIDFEIQLSDITPKFFRILKQFEPFGPNNMTTCVYELQLFQIRVLVKL